MKCALVVAVFAVCSAMVVAMPAPPGVQICPQAPPPPAPPGVQISQPKLDDDAPPLGVQICPPGPSSLNAGLQRPMTLEYIRPLIIPGRPRPIGGATTLDIKLPLIYPAIRPAIPPFIRPFPLPLGPGPVVIPNIINRPAIGNVRPLNLVLDAEASAPHIAVCPPKPADIQISEPKPAEDVKVADIQISEPKPAEA